MIWKILAVILMAAVLGFLVFIALRTYCLIRLKEEKEGKW